MMNRILAFIALALLPLAAMAQGSPGFVTGQVPTAAQWNGYFASKADLTGGLLSPSVVPPINLAATGIPGGVTSVLGGASGGTGINNGSSTITLGASLTTTGSGSPILAFGTGSFTYTFPGVSANLGYLVGAIVSGDCFQASGTTGGMSDAGSPCGSGGSGITQLTGDVTAGPGTGSQAAVVGAIGGKTVSLGASFSTTGTSPPVLAFGNGASVTYTFPGVAGQVTVKGNTVTGTGGTLVEATSPTITGLVVATSFTAPGLVTNADLANPALTIAGHSVSLGTSQAIACADLSTGAAGCSTAVGTSGAVLGLLNANLSFSGNDTFSGTLIYSGLGSGTQVSSLGIDSGNHVVLGSLGNCTITANTPDLVPGSGCSVGTVVPLNAQSGGSYAIMTTDNTKLIQLTNASATTVTIPVANSTGFTQAAGWGASIQPTLAATTITPASGTFCEQSSYVLQPGQFLSFAPTAGTDYACAVGLPPLVPSGTIATNKHLGYDASNHLVVGP